MVAKQRWFRISRKLMSIAILLAWLASITWLVKPVATLHSLEQIDGYPLYTMHYYGPYERAISTAESLRGLLSARHPSPNRSYGGLAWACSLFVALGDPDHQLYGRNFDWQYSPALLLFTDPPDGYASVSLVDIAYLGFRSHQVGGLTDRSLVERSPLLLAPLLPFDGMNEHGLAVGMAAVPPGGMQPDPDKETVGSLMTIREMLDHARNVEEAVAILGSYNIDMSGGPPIHYLVADASGHAVLVEFYQREMHVIPNQAPWHLATNFLRAGAGDSPQGNCWRYDRIDERLTEARGQVTAREAMDLLSDVSQPSTQWSIVYGMSSGQVDVAMGQAFDNVHSFDLSVAGK
jgi:hypothetical protein